MRISRRMALYAAGGPVYLIDGADQCTSKTGGWIAAGWQWSSSSTNAGVPTFSFSTSGMKVSPDYSGTYKGGIVYPKNAIDLSKFKTLYYIVGSASNIGSGNREQDRNIIGVFDMSKTYPSSTGGTLAYKRVVDSTAGTTYAIDISSITGTAYTIGCYAYTDSSDSLTWTVKQMWLEK